MNARTVQVLIGSIIMFTFTTYLVSRATQRYTEVLQQVHDFESCTECEQ